MGKNNKARIISLIFISLITFALLIRSNLIFIGTLASFIAILALDPYGFREFKNIKLWIFMLSFCLITALLVGEKDSKLGFIPYSSQGLDLSIIMLQRALIIYSCIILFTRNVSMQTLVEFFVKLNIKKLGISVSIALNLLPILRRNISQIYNSFRLKGGFRSHRIKNSIRFLIAIIVSTIRLAEEITEVLEVKGIID